MGALSGKENAVEAVNVMTMWINSVDSSRSDSLGRSSVLITMTKLLLRTRWRRKVFRCQAKKTFSSRHIKKKNITA